MVRIMRRAVLYGVGLYGDEATPQAIRVYDTYATRQEALAQLRWLADDRDWARYARRPVVVVCVDGQAQAVTDYLEVGE